MTDIKENGCMMNRLTYDKLNGISKMKPSEFVENVLNIKLFNHQKFILDNYNPKITYYVPMRNGKRLLKFYQACTKLSKMKEDDVIVIAKSDGCEEMNKNEFADYLMNRYWR